MFIHIKGSYTLLGTMNSKPEGQTFSFTVPLKNHFIVEVIINPEEKSIESFMDLEISEEMWKVLQTNLFDGNSMEIHLKEELNSMTSGLSQATRRVLSLIKYYLNQLGINEELFSVKSYFWSKDKKSWKQLPLLLSGVLDFHGFFFLKADTVSSIQEFIKNDFEPFLALKHLHRAKRESNPRYKYIDATIAAELAIKEFLIRKEPSLETLLLEVPSPPLYKLYGPILESYANQRSPKLKELQEGVEVRNKLIHKPKNVDIDPNKANTYVQDVEIAIFHLMNLLYPEDKIFQRFCKPEIQLKPVN
jgi:hypothetical protein